MIDRSVGEPPVPDSLDRSIPSFNSFPRRLVHNVPRPVQYIYLYSFLVSGLAFPRVISSTLHSNLQSFSQVPRTYAETAFPSTPSIQSFSCRISLALVRPTPFVFAIHRGRPKYLLTFGQPIPHFLFPCTVSTVSHLRVSLDACGGPVAGNSVVPGWLLATRLMRFSPTVICNALREFLVVVAPPAKSQFAHSAHTCLTFDQQVISPYLGPHNLRMTSPEPVRMRCLQSIHDVCESS
ncbi:hypothetical protein EV702DRAFT_1036098 [Suillus placidus]|uniref:Uncharacterized protein n=1 Tax=Suillus placidus TaxID=48579 RepID=A0A9P6ZJ48_9AGAM|nr:hypothetical protein EV702DRAFT_1036098 [Suillus placidus]